MLIQPKNKTRFFLSINLSDDEKIVLSKRINKFKVLEHACSQTKLKLINPLNYHINLAFLGAISNHELKKLSFKLKSIKFKPLECKITGLGVFPNMKEVKLIYLNVESKELVELAEKIRNIAISSGFKFDHEFKSHIIFARFKDKIELTDLDSINACFSFNSFYLMQSILTSAGVLYSKLEKFGSS